MNSKGNQILIPGCHQNLTIMSFQNNSGFVASLEANYYDDPEIFSLEQRTIFTKNWIFVAPVSELSHSGDFVTDEIAERPVVIIRNNEGDIRGYYNLCRHRASVLCRERQGNRKVFVCPYHSWSYTLDGQLKNCPGFEHEIKSRQLEMNLIPIRVEVWNELVFVCLDDTAPDLKTWMGDVLEIAERFPGVKEMEYEARLQNQGEVNWKTYSDNSAEGYHLDSVHKSLSLALVPDQTDIRNYENGGFTGFDVTYKGDSGQAHSKGFWIYKFPGLLLHFSENSFNIERVLPKAPVKTEIHRWFWFMPEVHKTQRQETVEFSNVVMDEDMEICFQVQRNLAGGIYKQGLLSKEREPGTVFFQSLVREHLK